MSRLFGSYTLTKFADALNGSPVPYQDLSVANNAGSLAGNIMSGVAHTGQAASKLENAGGVLGGLSDLGPIAKTLGGVSDFTGFASPFIKRFAPPVALFNAATELGKVTAYPQETHDNFMKSIDNKGMVGRGIQGFSNPFSALHSYSQEAENGAQIAGQNVGPMGEKLVNMVNSPAIKGNPMFEGYRQAANTGMSLSNYLTPSVQNAITKAKNIMTASEVPTPSMPAVPVPKIEPHPTDPRQLHAYPKPLPPPMHMNAQFGKQAPNPPPIKVQ